MILTISAIIGGAASACSGAAAVGGGIAAAAGTISAGTMATGAIGAIGASAATKALLVGSAKCATASALKGATLEAIKRATIKNVLESAASGAIKGVPKVLDKEALKEAAMKLMTAGAMKEVGESFVKNVFCDIVKPVVGSVLKCDLAGGAVSHTGIYIGNDRIVEVTEINHQAKVRIVNPREFLSGDGLLRTGVYIYIAAAKGSDGKYTAIHSASIAQRALMALGSRGKYSLVSNNCHMFTRYCINGENDDSPVWSADSLLGELERGLGVSGAVWRSTGVGAGDVSFA